MFIAAVATATAATEKAFAAAVAAAASVIRIFSFVINYSVVIFGRPYKGCNHVALDSHRDVFRIIDNAGDVCYYLHFSSPLRQIQ